MKISHTPSPMTARELLVSIAGDAHADHSVTNKVDAGISIMFTCSCGEDFVVTRDETNKDAFKDARRALRNVAAVAS